MALKVIDQMLPKFSNNSREKISPKKVLVFIFFLNVLSFTKLGIELSVATEMGALCTFIKKIDNYNVKINV